KDNCEIQTVSMQVLKNERKLGLPAVRSFWFPNGARRWIEKKCPVVRFPVVIAGSAEAERPAQDQNRRRPLPPAMIRINQRGIKWRQIGSPFIEFPFKRPQRRVKSESPQHH